jgi:hypothetical protein
MGTMKKRYLAFPPMVIVMFAFLQVEKTGMDITKSYSIDSLGACQGISYQKGKIFLYGDREVGMIREYKQLGDSLQYQNQEIRLTVDGKDVINHPTGMAVHEKMPVFIGNSIRLNPEGTLWKAVIYHVNWEGMQKTHTLDGNLLQTIDDDTCIQGTRPEYVEYNHKWYVATADYGDKGNEVRLYDPHLLAMNTKTTAKGVLVKKFTCTPWVQNLHWVPEKKQLVLIQNQSEGRKWRFTYIDLEKSIQTGKQETIRVVDINERGDELEGFTFLQSPETGIAVSSSRRNNVNFMHINW